MIPPEGVKPLADGLPDAEWRVFERSGHFAPIEEPALFETAVFDFLGVGGRARVGWTGPRRIRR